jgi:hypothetical protein
MQIPRITSFTTSASQYFLQSSWKGKTIQILCVVSFLSLIYYVAFRLKRKALPSDPTTLPGRVGVKPSKAKAAAPLKANLSYIKKATADPDFLKGCLNEFGLWLSDKMGICEKWITMANGNLLQQASCSRALRTFVPELKAQVEKMIPVFEAYPEAKEGHWDTFLKECDAAADPKADPAKGCEKLKACLTKLQSWDVSLQGHVRTKFMQQLSDVKNYPHYDFTDLQTQYFHYLGLHADRDFSLFLGTARGYLAQVGLLEMADVDLLQLRVLQPSIERLRQIFCLLNLTGNEKVLLPLIQKEIQQCMSSLDDLIPLLDVLKNEQELRDNLTNLLGLFGKLSENFAEGLTILKEIEQKDIVRQLLQLKGYIHQQDHLKKWKALKGMGFTRLVPYAKLNELSTPIAFYQMG